MAQPTNTFSAYSAIGIREDLSDVIYRIDPTEVPFTSSIGRGKASAKYHEWQIQRLAAASGSNAAIEGDDATAVAATPTSRVGNRTQISTKTAIVTGTLQAVNTAGRGNEMQYQVLLKGLELKRDIETALVQNNASVVGSNAAASFSGGFESWLTTNVSRGAAGANGGFSAGIVAAPTDGTQRAFTETLLKGVLAAVYTAGGRPTILSLGASQKQTFSSFPGIAVNRLDLKKPEMGAVIGAADVYVSDFGQLAVVPNIFQRNRTALVVSPKFLKLANMRPMKNWPLAKTGDSDKRQLLQEWTLEVSNEAAHGVVADLT